MAPRARIMTTLCSICDAPIEAQNWYQRATWTECSQVCRQKRCASKLAELRASGLPLVTITDHVVICNLCGSSLLTVGSHMKRRHGMDQLTKGAMSMSQRQVFYGITQGQRLATRDVREKYRANGHWLATHYPSRIKPIPERKLSKTSSLQTSNAKKQLVGAREARSKHAQVTSICLNCRNEFNSQRHRRRKYCSKQCAQKANYTALRAGHVRLRTEGWPKRRERINVSCETCKEFFITWIVQTTGRPHRRFCSSHCRQVHNGSCRRQNRDG